MTLPPISYSQFYREAVETLRDAGVAHAEREALWVLEHGLRIDRLDLHVRSHDSVNPDAYQRTLALLRRRASREPLQYVLGTQEFCGRELAVGPAVLIPRPETELIVEEVLARKAGMPQPLIVDVGTGSGCLAISLASELPDAVVVAIDRSPDALWVARSNAARHDVADRIAWIVGDLLTPLLSGEAAGKVTAIVANLPYVSRPDWEELPPDVKDFEPHLALDGGTDGFEIYRRVFSQLRSVLAVGGIFVMEIGMDQGRLVRREIEKYPFLKIVNIRRDGLGIERVVCLQRQRE